MAWSHEFSDIFKEKILSMGMPEPGVSGCKGPEISTVVQMKKSGGQNTPVLIRHMEDLMDKLEEYQLILKDLNREIKSAEPIVDSLIGIKDSLALKLYHLPENHGLKDILVQVLEIAGCEIKSFENGCYSN
jgi:hypothetical protein